MWLIVASLALGIALGLSGRVPAAVYNRLDRVMTIALFVMLTALGAQIGSNAELLANLPIIGQRAFVIALLSVGGSIGMLWLMVRWFRLSTQERKES